ncbi:hypothetical protein ACIBU0_16165 [Streptomyces sp. NPDC049627]|uniref:MmyB family transcriptional regulator n=1 Tax=Streptomyces sp. NPDC049627 TaxID=3365595 RepID=UPI0037B31650
MPDRALRDRHGTATTSTRCGATSSAPAPRTSADQRQSHLISQLRTDSAEFDDLWESGAVGRHQSARKTIDHPHVGALTLDCDVLLVAGNDLRVMIYTAEPGSHDAERLTLRRRPAGAAEGRVRRSAGWARGCGRWTRCAGGGRGGSGPRA